MQAPSSSGFAGVALASTAAVFWSSTLLLTRSSFNPVQRRPNSVCARSIPSIARNVRLIPFRASNSAYVRISWPRYGR
eukprot:11199870-Lingulodinium_polyedra.AAC.1